LWPAGKYVTTELVVRTAYLKAHADVVERLLRAHVDATDYVNAHPADAQRLANAAIKQITGKALSDAVIASAWSRLTFTVDPLTSTLDKEAAAAEAVGLLSKVDLKGIVDVRPLDRVLRAAGKPAVSA
jgi:NitT/TauT family transport system substrate-binding protein